MSASTPHPLHRAALVLVAVALIAWHAVKLGVRIGAALAGARA